MSERRLLTGNAAAAWGARLADIDYIPAFPITPQTEIIELLATWVAQGQIAARYTTMDSEHSMLTAAGAAAATGARVFTATSSQGLLYSFEMLYTVAGWRVPLVMVNVSRGLASPITLEADHNDILSARDSGFLQIHAETCQEVLDSILMAYRIAEDEHVMLPVLVNLDGFSLSFTREPVVVPPVEEVKEFLPTYEPRHAFIRGDHPMSQGTAVLGGAPYSYFRYQQHLAQQNALAVHDIVADEFATRFGRHYDAIDSFHLDDADYVLVMSNAFATKGRAAVERWRAQGKKVGLLRLRLLRPFPAQAIVAPSLDVSQSQSLIRISRQDSEESPTKKSSPPCTARRSGPQWSVSLVVSVAKTFRLPSSMSYWLTWNARLLVTPSPVLDCYTPRQNKSECVLC